ncbi:MAG: hypothetical protein HRT73_03395 [Flavobacteriales bacterium]|nr:hypothetical protein [Flavobacteriales bacterium]
MKKTILLSLLVCLTSTLIQAQNEPVNPFEELGYTPKIATLSKGKYVEFYDQDSIVQISHALFNVNTMKLVGFIQYDTTYSEATLEPEIISRWLSPDPLSSEFPSWSPYNYAADNPIFYTDPDGRAVRPVNADANLLLSAAYSSFGVSEKKFKDALKIQKPSSSGVIRSNLTIQGSLMSLSSKGFKKHLKNEGITLNKTQLNNAYNLYNAIKSKDVYEIAVFIKPTPGTTAEPGEFGTETVEGVSPSRNPLFGSFSRDFADNPNNLDALTQGEGYGVLVNSTTANSGRNEGTLGTVVIDATGKTPAETVTILNKVTEKIPKQ